MRIAYLVSNGPAANDTRVEREIAAVEEAGAFVVRFAIGNARLVGDAGVPMPTGLVPLMFGVVGAAFASPSRFFHAARLVVKAVGADVRHGWDQIADFASACWLARRLDGAHHLHADSGAKPAAVARLAHYLTGLPYSFAIHDPDEYDSPQSLGLPDKIADAQSVIVASSYARGQLMRWSGPGDWGRIAVIRFGLDETVVQHAPDRIEPILCGVAGVPLLLDAVARIKATNPNFRLLLIGANVVPDATAQMIASRGLSETVSRVGATDPQRTRDMLLGARAMVLLSDDETVPMTILEAFALGTPVIASAIGGTPELVDGDCGWLVPVGSVDALMTAMEHALSAPPETLRTMGEVGRRRVLDQHDATQNGAAMVRRFEQAA